MRSAVGQIRAAAMTDLRRWVAFASALAVLTVVVSLWFARSISLPLQRLAVRAEAVSAGDLDQPPLGRQGQRDIAVTFEAFDDLTANLRLLEAKANALAALDFESESLAKPLPGRLGQSLQRSVQVLSGSILERDQLQKNLEQQATHDALTGLHNRAAAGDALERALARSRRSGVGLAVLFVDLDDFKRANDTFGHAVGDEVLREVAGRMSRVARAGDFVARLGGDEFMILVENVREADEVAALADRMVKEVGRQIELSSLRVQIGASVGIAFAWSGEEEAAQLLAWADLAVYRAKQRSSGRVEIYDTTLQQQLLERADIEDALARAIPAGELFLLYQPVIDVVTGRLSGLEALVRWDRPGHGIQPPNSFIPIAETSNLIIDLDRWVLEEATRQMAAWRDTPELAHVGMAVNVSGRHLLSQTLHDHMVGLMDRWAELGLDPSRLTLEITETILLNDLAHRRRAARGHPGAGRRGGDRRLRHRLHERDAPPAAADRRDQDRPDLHQPAAHPERPGAADDDHGPRPPSRRVDHRRGRRDRGPVRRARRHRLRPGAGLLPGPPAHRRRSAHVHPGGPAGAHPTLLISLPSA